MTAFLEVLADELRRMRNRDPLIYLGLHAPPVDQLFAHQPAEGLAHVYLRSGSIELVWILEEHEWSAARAVAA